MKPLPSSRRESLERAVLTFQAHLAAGGPAAEYVYQERGIAPAWARDFRLGYVADDTVPGFEWLQGRLAIPNICASGHVVGIKFRDLTGHSDMKYAQPAGQANRVFNTRALVTDADSIAVTEGEIDAIVLTMLGVPAVGIPGTDGWKKGRTWRLFEGFRRVVLIRDGDEAGGVLEKQMLATDLPVHVVRPPHGVKDVNDAYLAGYGDELVELVNGARG